MKQAGRLSSILGLGNSTTSSAQEFIRGVNGRTPTKLFSVILNGRAPPKTSLSKRDSPPINLIILAPNSVISYIDPSPSRTCGVATGCPDARDPDAGKCPVPSSKRLLRV